MEFDIWKREGWEIWYFEREIQISGILKNNFRNEAFQNIFRLKKKEEKKKIILDELFDNVHVKFSNFQSVYGRFSR